MNFYIADTHFCHKNIMKYENRPFDSVEEMDQTIINNWNKKIKINDTIYIIGDFAFGKPEQIKDIINNLNGKKILVKGNHDKTILKNNELRDMFFLIKDYMVIKENEDILVLFHYPIHMWDRSHYGSYHLFGHVHSSFVSHAKNAYNVGVDVNSFEPLTFKEIKNKIENDSTFIELQKHHK